MRLGIGTNTIEPHLCHGPSDGIGVYTRELIRHFTAERMASVTPVYFPKLLQWAPGSVRSDKFFLPYPVLATLTNLCDFPFWFSAAVVEKIDLYHATDYRIPRLNKIPVVATLHDAVQLNSLEWVRDQARAYKNWVLRAAALRADLVIAISEAAVPDLVEAYGIDQAKIRVIHNGISQEWLESLAKNHIEQILKKYGLTRNYILFVGTFQPRKNLGRILSAYEALPSDFRREFSLVLVGQEGWKVDNEVAQIRSLEVRGECCWLKNVPSGDLKALYQGASLFLFPSLLEGFGIPVLEAFASRVPVITSNITALPEVAGDAALLVDPYNVDEITYGIERVLVDTKLRSQLIDKGCERAKELSWQRSAEKTIEVYKELL
ncbi:glycosyltransferase family 4 protein [bacterium]|nr:glycosyltransferase family 4 protein [bacterium]